MNRLMGNAQRGSHMMLITDEGEQYVQTVDDSAPVAAHRIFSSYPRRSVIWSVSLAIIMVFLITYLVFDFNIHRKIVSGGKEMSPDAKKVQQVPVSPFELVEVRDFTEVDITGFSSGRKESFISDVVAENIKHMLALNIPCATPWIVMTYGQRPRTAPVSFNNVLSLKGMDMPLLNVKIESREGGTTLVSAIPFNYKDITRTSRVYYNQVTISHSKGKYTTTTADEAFCLQELY